MRDGCCFAFSGKVFFSGEGKGVSETGWSRCVCEVKWCAAAVVDGVRCWCGADSGEEFAVPICSSLLVVREGWWSVRVVAADAEVRRWRCGGSAVVA